MTGELLGNKQSVWGIKKKKDADLSNISFYAPQEEARKTNKSKLKDIVSDELG